MSTKSTEYLEDESSDIAMPSPGHSLPESETSSIKGAVVNKKDKNKYFNILKKELEKLVATPETTDTNEVIDVQSSKLNRYYDE